MQSSNILFLNVMEHHQNLTYVLHSFIRKRFAANYPFLHSLDLFFWALKEVFLPLQSELRSFFRKPRGLVSLSFLVLRQEVLISKKQDTNRETVSSSRPAKGRSLKWRKIYIGLIHFLWCIWQDFPSFFLQQLCHQPQVEVAHTHTREPLKFL